MNTRIPRLAAVAVLVAAAAAQAPASPDLLVQAATLVATPDAILRPGEMLVRQGKVAYLGAEIPIEARSKAQAVAFAGATVVPGFVIPHAWLGQEADLAERAHPFTPDLRASEAFDPFQDELGALPRCGVTSCALSPSARNVAGGIAALVKPGKDGGELATDDLYLALSLTAAARDPERPPTSLMGAIDLLRKAFRMARDGVQGGPAVAVVLQRGRRLFVQADTWAELAAALDFAREFGIEPVLVGAAEAEKVLPRLKEQRAAVVLGALSPDQRLAMLRLPALLAREGVPFAFAAARPEHLRLSAALAVQHGLPRAVALAALTRTPAALLDQQDRIGALRSGCDADFAVFGGDPLDLGSPLLAVYVRGVRLHAAARKPADTPRSSRP
jgi:imidazolonepropionase-like amidohydrolase